MIQKTPQAGDDLGRFPLGCISIFLFQSASIRAFARKSNTSWIHIISYISTRTPEPE